MHKSLFVGGVLARRTFLAFGLFAFLCVAVISATYVASRYALKRYVEDQLERITWDLSFHQMREIPSAPELLAQVRSLPNVIDAQSMAFLRTRMPPGLEARAGHEPVLMPWFVVLAATHPGLLPPEYRAPGDQVVLALFGVKETVQFNLERLQGARSFSFVLQQQGRPSTGDGHGHTHESAEGEPAAPARELLQLPISQIVELDRDELNRWFLEHTGAIAFVPFMGAALNMQYDAERLKLLDSLFRAHVHEEEDAHIESGDYLPEVNHVARLDRVRLISGWDLDASFERLATVAEQARQIAPESAQVFVRSDSLILLQRMNETATLVGWVALLLALPLIGIAWVFAANLVQFVFLNERRSIGLMRLRGLTGDLMVRIFLTAILAGGLAGGLAGLALGTVIPLAAYEGFGSVLPLLGIQRPLMAFSFLGFGLIIALIIGRRLVRAVRRLAPGEAVRRFSEAREQEATVRFGILPALALFLGLYKILAWWGGLSLGQIPILSELDQLLDFVAVPLLIYGIGVFFASRRKLVATSIRWLAPLSVGRLKRFAVEQGAYKPARLASVLLVGSLAAAIVLAPSVASNSFTNKAHRGVRAQVGADAQLLFNSLDVPGQPYERLGPELTRLSDHFRTTLEELQQSENVRSVVGMTRALIPMYMPGYGFGGVSAFVLQDPERYLQNAYWEESLGIDQPFSSVMKRVAEGAVAVSPAVAEFWEVKAGDSIVLGVDEAGNGVVSEVAGVVAGLPGAPRRAVNDRDSFVSALTDYLNFLFAKEAFVVASADHPSLGHVTALVPQMVALVRTNSEFPSLEGLTLPARGRNLLPQEIARTQQDMFIYLVGENLKIYLVGGFLIALSAIFAIFLVNYWEGRRTFALLRVRGASPRDLIGALSVQLYSPLVWSLLAGGLVGAAAGYGIAHRIWGLQRVLTVIQQLPTHLILTARDALLVIGILLLLLLLVIALGFWTFRRSAREAVIAE
ncbi:MAG: hypothetical protein HY645_03265 [Acidobacteria bacterium]|nr:hypothetical protein [Acidobacteriota bacterium]